MTIDPKLQEYRRRAQLKRNYNLTIEEYADILENQDYSCGVCGIDKCSSGRRFAVDHCHKTGEIRGILCGRCNLALGQVDDSIEKLTQLIAYLDRHKEERIYRYINSCSQGQPQDSEDNCGQ